MLHIDPNPIRVLNETVKGGLRKNGCLVSTGTKLTKEFKKQLIKNNTEMWGIPPSEYLALEVSVRYHEPKMKNIF